MQNAESAKQLIRRSFFYGRNGGIRTRDPLHPMQVRYQAALHSERDAIIDQLCRACLASPLIFFTARLISN